MTCIVRFPDLLARIQRKVIHSLRMPKLENREFAFDETFDEQTDNATVSKCAFNGHGSATRVECLLLLQSLPLLLTISPPLDCILSGLPRSRAKRCAKCLRRRRRDRICLREDGLGQGSFPRVALRRHEDLPKHIWVTPLVSPLFHPAPFLPPLSPVRLRGRHAFTGLRRPAMRCFWARHMSALFTPRPLAMSCVRGQGRHGGNGCAVCQRIWFLCILVVRVHGDPCRPWSEASKAQASFRRPSAISSSMSGRSARARSC